MKTKIITFLLALSVVPLAAHAQETVCALFSHLENSDGQQVSVTGELLISKAVAILGAAECDSRYTTRMGTKIGKVFYIWPVALGLRPSAATDPAQITKLENAQSEADHLRRQGKVVRASATFSGQLRVGGAGDFAAELIFDSFKSLKVDALPDASSLRVISICDLFKDLQSWSGKRVAIRGEIVSSFEGAWIVGRCKGGFYTDGYRWPVALSVGSPAYASVETDKLTKPSGSTPDVLAWSDGGRTATFVGVLRTRSKYTVYCSADGHYESPEGFGHMNGGAGELLIDSVLNAQMEAAPLDSGGVVDTDMQRCQRTSAPK